MRLRDYQITCNEATAAAHAQHTAALVVMATGLGKTVTFTHYAKDRLVHGRTMIVAHRRELIHQAAGTFHRIVGEHPEIDMAEMTADAAGGILNRARGVIASVQTLSGKRGDGHRMRKFDPREFGTLIIDEAHHAVADTYRRVVDHFTEGNPDLKVLGVTATPDRSDEIALGKLFETCPFELGIRAGYQGGWLVRPLTRMIFAGDIDLRNVRTVGGDFKPGELAAVMAEDGPLHQVASPTIELVGDGKALVFTAGVAQAERMTAILNAHKRGSAQFVYAKTPKDERRHILGRYRDGCFQFLVNVGVFTEGYDDPGITHVVMARPTKSRALYVQMVGRGTRSTPDADIDRPDLADDPEGRKSAIGRSRKPTVDVIDFTGNCGKHKLVTMMDVLGGDYEADVVSRAAKKIKSDGGAYDPERALAEAQHEMRQERMALAAVAYAQQIVDPFDLLDVTPYREAPWHQNRKPTDKMQAMLERNGIKVPADMTFTEARRLIDAIIERRDKQLCTVRQAKQLRKRGIDPAGVTFADAGAMLDSLMTDKIPRADQIEAF